MTEEQTTVLSKLLEESVIFLLDPLVYKDKQVLKVGLVGDTECTNLFNGLGNDLLNILKRNGYTISRSDNDVQQNK